MSDDVTCYQTVFVCLPEILDGQRSPEVPQDLQKNPGPVTSVAQLPQVRQRLLWRPDGALQLGQLITCTHSSKNKCLLHWQISVLLKMYLFKTRVLSELMFCI